MKKIKTTSYSMKIAQTETNYNMDMFLDEVFGEKIKTTDAKTISGELDKDTRLEWNYMLDQTDEHSLDSGSEEVEVKVSGMGVILCPLSFVDSHSIEALENAIKEAVNEAPEIYIEGYEGGVWEDVASRLNDLEHLQSGSDLKDSSAWVEIEMLKPISQYEAKIIIRIDAQADWHGETHEPDPPDRDEDLW